MTRFSDPQAMVHLRNNGSGDADGSVASSAEVYKSAQNAGPGQCSFDERSYKLTTFAVGSFERLVKSSIELFDRLASSLARVADDGNLCREGVVKEHARDILIPRCRWLSPVK